MSTPLKTVQEINTVRKISYFLSWIVRIVRATILSYVLVGLWTLIWRGDESGQLLLLVTSLLIGIFFSSKNFYAKLLLEDFLTYLEIRYKDVVPSPLALKNDVAEVPPAWKEILAGELSAQKRSEGKKLVYLLSTLPIPLVLAFLLSSSSQSALGLALTKVSEVVQHLNRGVTLSVVEGFEDPKKSATSFSLSDSKVIELELLSENMVRIDLAGDTLNHNPVVELRDAKTDPKVAKKLQSFLMTSSGDVNSPEKKGAFFIEFSVVASSYVFIPSFSDKPLARIVVKNLPVPEVTLQPSQPIQDSWSDDEPLNLNINVKSENPLQLVRLQIESEGRKYTELVNNILANDMTDFNSQYEVLFEQYIQSDVSEVMIIAEAVDRSLPRPLIGRSKPLVVKVVSAYGRYIDTLNTMKEAKSILEEMVDDKESKDRSEELKRLARDFDRKAGNSPFFDGLDRVNIQSLRSQLENLPSKAEKAQVLEVEERMSDFLFEHEIINDRERDRDFFVAARALSRVIEQAPDNGSPEVKRAAERLHSFLDARHKRWQTRVSRLDDPPKSWNKIKQKPFHKAVKGIIDDDKEPMAKEQHQLALSKSVGDFNKWIEELEAAEDAFRQQEEHKHEQGLANAQEVLKELQRKQGQISGYLDQADKKEQQQLKDGWPAWRMEQNENARKTGALQAQMQVLAPLAAERIKVAREAMEQTTESANGEQFANAESSSDLAGRLLRQAKSEAEKAQNQKQKRGRRRRVSGDNYFGSQVVGDVEIKREYEVSRRYREDILDDLQSTGTQKSKEEDNLLENYIRRVIR
ncbi:MAG: hypothetical protein AB7T49_20965 [Oligoflexales bacterium]